MVGVRAITRPAAVYRLRDVDGILLYVGSGVDPFHRVRQHAKLQSWGPDVVDARWEWFDSETAAREAERLAIQQEKPRYNTIRYHCPGQTTKLSGYLPLKHFEFLGQIAKEATYRRPGHKPVIRQIHVIRRAFELLEAGETITTERLIADLAANPPQMER